ncbi:MAG: PEP-CTERM sorting domain-containing protein, partial [Sandarakinorhabdus sp.]|nr:PEP-CTERM sorting domain-containing protein [Sandarakinorhabdus sp.]
IVAFSCFADPLGRGSLSSVFTIPGFGPSTCNDYRSGSPDRPSPYSLKLPVIDEYGRIVFTADGTAPIPEPDTWAMLILGFGLVGFSMRRRKKLEITAS